MQAKGHPIEVDVLGPLALRVAGRSVTVSSARERAALSVLALSAGRDVGVQELCTALWGDPLPSSARKTLQVHVLRLRRRIDALGIPGSEVVATAESGYRLAADPEAVDAMRFERLAAQGRRALEAGDPEGAARLLTEALALWRGEPIPDLAETMAGQTETARLLELRLAVLEYHNEAELALGHHSHLVSRIEAQVAESPLRERLWYQLMLAQYRSDRQADALRAYQRARDLLVEELGIEPGRELRRLETEIIAQDPALEWTAPSTTLVTAPDRRPSVPIRQGPAGDEAGSGARAWADSLRERALVDRVAELAVVDRAFEAAGRGLTPVTISGRDGTGKTRFLAEVVSRLVDKAAFVLVGQSNYRDHDEPGHGLCAAVDRWARFGAPDDLALSEGSRASLAGLSPVFADRLDVRDAAPVTEVYALATAVAELVSAARGAVPAVLIMDDVTHVDPFSLEVLRTVGELQPDLPLLVVGAYIESLLGIRPLLAELLADAHRLPGAVDLVLGGLPGDDGVRLMADRLGWDDDRAAGSPTLQRLCEEAAGNPRHLVQLAGHLQATQAEFDPSAALGIEDIGLPAGLLAAVRRSLQLMVPQNRAVLEAAAVVGVHFEVSVLGQLLDRPEAEVWTAFDGPLVADMTGPADPSGRGCFASTVFREAVFDLTPPGRRGLLQRRLAALSSGG